MTQTLSGMWSPSCLMMNIHDDVDSGRGAPSPSLSFCLDQHAAPASFGSLRQSKGLFQTQVNEDGSFQKAVLILLLFLSSSHLCQEIVSPCNVGHRSSLPVLLHLVLPRGVGVILLVFPISRLSITPLSLPLRHLFGHLPSELR